MNVPEKHRAIAHAWVDGAKVEARNHKSKYPALNEWQIIEPPAWLEDWEYRIKLIKPSINWEHVAPEYVALVTDRSGNSYIFTRVPEATANTWVAGSTWKSAEVFQSFVKGTCDWKDSLVLRPSAASEKVVEADVSSPTTAHVPTSKLEWSKTLVSGKRVTFADAEKAVAELGDGWRLPTRQEFESIQDLSRHDPCIDTAEFTDTKSEPYWSSSPCAWDTSARWVVHFSAGAVSSFHLYGNACVRAVKGGVTQ